MLTYVECSECGSTHFYVDIMEDKTVAVTCVQCATRETIGS